MDQGPPNQGSSVRLQRRPDDLVRCCERWPRRPGPGWGASSCRDQGLGRYGWTDRLSMSGTTVDGTIVDSQCCACAWPWARPRPLCSPFSAVDALLSAPSVLCLCLFMLNPGRRQLIASHCVPCHVLVDGHDAPPRRFGHAIGDAGLANLESSLFWQRVHQPPSWGGPEASELRDANAERKDVAAKPAAANFGTVPWSMVGKGADADDGCCGFFDRRTSAEPPYMPCVCHWRRFCARRHRCR
ncbi:hypothetical protein B0J13DRAFT_603598 [Dactylonectria estremocensis]|uniref:Uncharacterized protein n=1 Tax=Dactylonectria estremocensis TaxID=1079267 RepID=A0A9P9FDN9_9HYPO|nr:hypothetical protein B0J13DRAFT_603598 [Dactylonectria estremocensis]